ncbi:MAG TPA: X-Pro dipeptidyl-peptidase, partial [Sphingobacterium sp.]|nr:X-Pro dipeptidyl-peptidase [Sphingobacterium sp.]
MKKALIVFSALVISVTYQVKAQETLETNYVKTHYDKKEITIPMRDGVKLFTTIYTPKDKSQRYPVLLNRTPYTVGPYGE